MQGLGEMEKRFNVPVRFVLSGDVANTHDTKGLIEVSHKEVSDIRYQPFPRQEYIGKGTVTIPVTKWFGPECLFTMARKSWVMNLGTLQADYPPDPSEYISMLNQWLAALDYFGFDAPYSLSFVKRIEIDIVNIAAYAYLEEGADISNGTRRVNGMAMTGKQFFTKLISLCKRYEVPVVLHSY
jgi:hypothetical protein